MAVNQLAGDDVFRPLTGDQQRAARADGDGYEDRGGIGEPAGCGPRRRRARRLLGAQCEADARAQRFRCAIDWGVLPDAVAQPGEGGGLRSTFRTIREMGEQQRAFVLGELLVNKGVEPRADLITLHRQYPFPPKLDAAPSGRDGAATSPCRSALR